MNRSLLRPIRTRRVTRSGKTSDSKTAGQNARLTPATRKTIAAIGALWVSFAVNTSATPIVPAGTEPDAAHAADRAPLDGSHHFMSPLIDCTDDDHRPSFNAEGETEFFGILQSTPAPGTVVPLRTSPAATSLTTLPASESRNVVFLTTGPRSDHSLPERRASKVRPKGSDSAAVLAYLKSISR